MSNSMLPGARRLLRRVDEQGFQLLMMEGRPSRSHGRGGQRTPYLRQTSSGCACRCPGRCRTCPASKYDASGALEHLQLLLLLHLSFARAWCRGAPLHHQLQIAVSGVTRCGVHALAEWIYFGLKNRSFHTLIVLVPCTW